MQWQYFLPGEYRGTKGFRPPAGLCLVDGGYSAQVTRLASIILFLILPLAAEEILTSAAQVAEFPGNDPEEQPSVSLEATVTYIDTSGTVFLADATGATFLSRVKEPSVFKPGQVLSVEGTRLPGLFIGGIIASKTEVIGSTPLPPPRSVNLQELSSGRFHYQLVAMEGIGRSVKREGETSAVLRLAVPGGIISVRLDQAQGDLDYMVDAELRVTGLAAGGIDDRRRLVDPYLVAVLPEGVEVLEDAPGSPPVATVAGILKGWEMPAHRVAIRGTALSPVLDDAVFIRDATGTMKVTPDVRVNVEAGMEVEVLGFPERGRFSPFLDGAEVRAGGSVELPHMTVVDGKNITSAALDADLVAAEGTLTGTNPHVLSLAGKEIRVVPPPGVAIPVETGSKVRLTGIWQVTSTETGGYNATPSAFSLLLRSADDVEVLSAPPWWTPGRLGILLAVISAAALLALVWATILRIQVSKQVRLIEAKTQREAVAEERQRIAREFHDTLEQELAGLSIRLDAALPRVPDEKASGLLTQLRTLLIRMQTETRDFILDLRETDPAPLSESLGSLVDDLQTTTGIPLELEMENVPNVPPHTRHHLLRITREAVNNAIRHSEAETIAVSLKGGTLTIRDDGKGFDPATTDATRFGVQGMRERAAKIKASLDTASSTKGTTIEVRFPLP